MEPEMIDADEANTRNREDQADDERDGDQERADQKEHETEQREADQLPAEGYSDY